MTYPVTVPAFEGQRIQRLKPGQWPMYLNAKGKVRYLVSSDKIETQDVKDDMLTPPSTILQVPLGWSPDVDPIIQKEEDRVLALFAGCKDLQISLGDPWRVNGPFYYLVVSIVAKE